jgi:thiosulfate/3-mercaptopyruvate sulfurtransferase
MVAVGGSLAGASASGAQPADRTPPAAFDSLIVSTGWLAAHLRDPQVVVVEVTMDGQPRHPRIPGARRIPYGHVVITRDGIGSELPTTDSLRAIAEGLGISSTSRVVAYAHAAPMAARFLLSLEAAGVRRVSYLDGGLAKWQAEGRPVTEEEPTVVRGTIARTGGSAPIVDAAWLEPRVGTPGLSLIDTRTTGEYVGTGNRSGMPSAGHLAGARQLEWEWMFDTANPLRLKSEQELRALFSERVRTGDAVVTYCWVGYRASATWLVARALGYDARLYDGSYQDWQRRRLPTRAGATP